MQTIHGLLTEQVLERLDRTTAEAVEVFQLRNSDTLLQAPLRANPGTKARDRHSKLGIASPGHYWLLSWGQLLYELQREQNCSDEAGVHGTTTTVRSFPGTAQTIK